MSAPDRPTREQVDAALRLADPSNHEAARVDALPRALAGFRILAAEVHALRAELDGLRIGLDVETRRADDWQRVADGLAQDAARAAGVARTPQPAETVRVGDPCPWDGPDGVHETGTGRDRAECRYCDGTIDAVPQPAEPRRTDVCTCSGTEDPPLPSEMDPACPLHGLAPLPAVPDGEDANRVVLAGEDVPARLDAAADVIDAHNPYSCAGGNLRGIATSLRLSSPETRAAVAAALARPTERER